MEDLSAFIPWSVTLAFLVWAGDQATKGSHLEVCIFMVVLDYFLVTQL